MANYGLNRARLLWQGDTPMSVNNSQSIALASGLSVTAPLVALAYSWAMLHLDGNSSMAGKKVTITCGGASVVVTLDDSGHGKMSLTPFIRNEIKANGVLVNPLYCDDNASYQQNGFRGSMVVTIQEEDEAPQAMNVFYVFGNYAPQGERVTDLYFDYDANGVTWCNIDSVSNYSGGTPISFEQNWWNVDEALEDAPSGDFTLTLPVAWFYGSGIWMDNIVYHFRYDCRDTGVVKLRWLDTDGNVNQRKFTVASKSFGSTAGDGWKIPHDDKELELDYNHGADVWREIVAAETLTVGDDCIPIEQYDWLKSATSAPVAQVYLGGIWVKCDIADASVTIERKKSTFSITLTLALPVDDVQQF